MSTPSKVTSPRRTRKTKSVAQPTVYPLSRYEIERRAYSRGMKELVDFIATLSESEKLVIGHTKPFGDPANGLKEIRRLLGESIAQCKIIPFPVGGKRGAQVAKEASS